MKIHVVLLVAWLLSAAVPSTEEPKGLWLTPRKDSRNQARADVAGKMAKSPQEVWCMATGGEVRFVQNVRMDGKDAALMQVGSTLQLIRWTGERVYQDFKTGGGSVLRVDDFDGDGAPEMLVRTDSRTVALLDVTTGKKLWSWQSPPSTQVNGHAFYETPNGLRFICFPSYSDSGYCFDFSKSRENPKLLWQRRYVGKYGIGYGPNIVLKDMDGDGEPDIVLSGKVPSVYQAVIDADTGAMKFDAHYDVEGGWGRPYGLLHAVDLDGDGKPEIVMVSCQVEEYVAVARNVGGKRIEKIWGKFIEKDWPTDERELRPQVTSLADVQGNGKVELVVGVYENHQWRTLVIDPLKDFSAQRGALKGYYFWGCYDLTGDGTPEIIVSEEARRRPARVATLRALDGKTFQPVAKLADAAVFTSADSDVPPDVYFMSLRRNPVFLKTADGVSGILIHRFNGGREEGVYLWGGKAGMPIGARRVANAGWTRIDLRDNDLFLSDMRGNVQRFDRNLKPVGKRLATQGRASQPLVWSVGGKRELVVDAAGGMVLGGVPNFSKNGKLEGAWQVAGSMPALHRDSAGQCRLSVADLSDPDNPTLLVYQAPVNASAKPLRIPLTQPLMALVPFGDTFHLFVNLQTGVHTAALACYDANGRLLWEDRQYGAHPNLPGAADLNGDGECEVIADDHGILRIHDSAGKIVGTHPGWPPAYTLPIAGPFGRDASMAVLRSSGIDGMSLNDPAGKPLWSLPKPASERYRWYGSLGAVGDLTGDGRFALGIVAEDGAFECVDAQTGRLRWSLALRQCSNRISVVAGDVDGNGADEFLVGLSDGRLLCIGERSGQGKIVWEKTFAAAVANPIIADVDGDGSAEIALSTSDGCVRILK
jgi:outer membrane protein assembly factor BamB